MNLNNFFILKIAFLLLFCSIGNAKSHVSSIIEAKNIQNLNALTITLFSDLEDLNEISLVLTQSGDLVAKSKTDLIDSDTVCASAQFEPSLEQIGWHQLDVQSTANCGRLGSMFAAGWVEGYLSHEAISEYHHNLRFANDGSLTQLDSIKPNFETAYFNTVDKASREIENFDNKIQTRNFWSGIELFASQFEGVLAGYKARSSESELTRGDFLLINANGEISDVLQFFKAHFKNFENSSSSLLLQKSAKHYKKRLGHFHRKTTVDEIYNFYNTKDSRKIWVTELEKSHCSAIVKLLRDDEGLIKDVMMAHGTWDAFECMVKVMKRYDFKISKFDGEAAEEHKIVFPSYPGAITSQDDFYVTGNGLAITETTLNVFDKKLYSKYMHPDDYIPSFLRLASTNFMSKTANEWVEYFSISKKGTYSSQWMVLDTKLLKQAIDKPNLAPQTFFVLENVPGFMEYHDKSEHLDNLSFWSSFNLPIFDEIYTRAGCALLAQDGGSLDYSREENPRARTFRELQSEIKDIETLKKVIRYNQAAYEKDDLIVQDDQIAPRLDLDSFFGSRNLYGETDAKLTNLELAEKMTLMAISGPVKLASNIFTFTNDEFEKIQGLPQSWDFEWITFGPVA